MSDARPLPPTMLDINSPHVTESERVFSCPHVVVTLQPEPPVVAACKDASWVLVKGYCDSGTIDGVFGPYTGAYIDWLLSGLLEYSSSNWTKVKLSSGPEEA